MTGQFRLLRAAGPSAVISECGKYRYRLDRDFGSGPLVCWVMLNPSTADGHEDDATIRKIRSYSRAWGFGSLVVVNLWAWRATDPKAIPFHRDAVGPLNNEHVATALAESSRVVCAWGVNHQAKHPQRARIMLDAIERAGRVPEALRVSKDGHPCHPLYLPGKLKLAPLAHLRGEP